MLVSFEKNLLISLLKLTEKGSTKQEIVNIDSKLPSSLTSTLLHKLQNENIVNLKKGSVEVDTESRLKLAVKAIRLGADVECVSNFLRWQEFEAMAALALELNGYVTQKNVRFKQQGRRWEIDVIGCRKPLVVCVDCKHWHHGMHASTLGKMTAAQADRVAAFAESLPSIAIDLPCVRWEKAKFIPVILSLTSFAPKFCDKVPVVPVLQLQEFINQLPLNVESVKYFPMDFSNL
jgi:Holliday junction resolvase-like predicted endonuclease